MAVTITDKDRGYKKLQKVFSKQAEKPAAVRVGVQGSDAMQLHGKVTVVDIATVHEFGSIDGRIPQRSFIRSTFDKNRAHYQKVINKIARDVLDEKLDAARALGLLGEKFVADIKAAIRAHIDPPLADSTIRARTGKIKNLAGNKNQSAATAAMAHLDSTGALPSGAITPLIDTGRLINSIRSVPE